MCLKFKVKCINNPDESCIRRYITIGNIYEVQWVDESDYKIVKDDAGGKGYYYRRNCFEDADFNTSVTNK